MAEGKFEPRNPEKELEKDRLYWTKEVDKINNIKRIEDILGGLGIVITEPFDNLRMAQEALKSFIRGYKQPQLDNLRSVIGELDKVDEDL